MICNHCANLVFACLFGRVDVKNHYGRLRDGGESDGTHQQSFAAHLANSMKGGRRMKVFCQYRQTRRLCPCLHPMSHLQCVRPPVRQWRRRWVVRLLQPSLDSLGVQKAHPIRISGILMPNSQRVTYLVVIEVLSRIDSLVFDHLDDLVYSKC